jgi:hypothetical protein
MSYKFYVYMNRFIVLFVYMNRFIVLLEDKVCLTSWNEELDC